MHSVAPEPDPFFGPVWCSSSRVQEHGSACSPWIRAAKAEGGTSESAKAVLRHEKVRLWVMANVYGGTRWDWSYWVGRFG